MGLMEKINKKQSENVKRMTVGPVPSHPKILEMMGKQYFSTRDSLFVEVFIELQKYLKESVGTTENFVILEHGSGSSGMCSIGNHLLCPGDKVITINTGKFGERWTKIAKKRGCEVCEIEVTWGVPVDWEEVSKKLSEIKPVALLMQHSETSTGSLNSLEEASKVIEENSPDTLLVVDAISSWGSIPINMDENSLDVVVGCSQKGFMLPTGLHTLVFSKKALSKIEENSKAGKITDFSHDPIKDIEAQKKGKPRFSMDSNSIMALYYYFTELLPEIGGWNKLYEKVKTRAEKIRKAVSEIGYELFSESPSDAVIAIKKPEGKEVKDIRNKLYELGFETNKSQDETKFDGFRIGNMGYVTDEDIDKLLGALKEVIKLESVFK